ncbi:MAG TPA: hypothetical protein VGL20_20355 [Candidatus Dormibacteraeota bacterium]
MTDTPDGSPWTDIHVLLSPELLTSAGPLIDIEPVAPPGVDPAVVEDELIEPMPCIEPMDPPVELPPVIEPLPAAPFIDDILMKEPTYPLGTLTRAATMLSPAVVTGCQVWPPSSLRRSP